MMNDWAQVLDLFRPKVALLEKIAEIGFYPIELAVPRRCSLTLLPPLIVDADISLLLLTLSKRQHFFINEPIKLLKKS